MKHKNIQLVVDELQALSNPEQTEELKEKQDCIDELYRALCTLQRRDVLGQRTVDWMTGLVEKYKGNAS